MAILRSNFDILHQYHEFLKAQTSCSGASLKNYEFYENLILDWAAEEPLEGAQNFAIPFPKFLLSQKNEREKSYSSEYMKGVCGFTRRFFLWARDNREEFRLIKTEWITKIKPIKSIEDVQEIYFYTLEDVQKICELKPENMRLRRAIAALAFLLLSGMRISAFFTLPIKNVDLKTHTVHQLPSDGVCTKYNKAAITTILINSKLMEIVNEWDNLVRSQCPPDSSWYARLDSVGNLDPRAIIPMTIENKDELKIKARNPYSGFRKDLQKVCKMAGVVYKSPHKARYGHIHLGFSKAKTAEERKAVSVNAMHESLSITDEVYARMSSDHANNILLSFNFDDDSSYEDDFLSDNQKCITDSDAINKMMTKVFSSIDPDMVIQAGIFMKKMKKES